MCCPIRQVNFLSSFHKVLDISELIFPSYRTQRFVPENYQQSTKLRDHGDLLWLRITSHRVAGAVREEAVTIKTISWSHHSTSAYDYYLSWLRPMCNGILQPPSLNSRISESADQVSIPVLLLRCVSVVSPCCEGQKQNMHTFYLMYTHVSRRANIFHGVSLSLILIGRTMAG